MAFNRTRHRPVGSPRSHPTSTVLAWILPYLLEHLATRGYDSAALRRLPGLAGRDLDDPDVRVADASAAEAWHLAEQITGDEAIGLHMAQSVPAGALDILEYAFRSSATVRSGLDQLVRYVRAVSDRAIAEIDLVGDALAFTWVEPAQSHRVEFAFALIVRMAREATSARIAPRRVDFAHRPPDNRSAHRAFFGAPVRFGKSSNQLLFSQADLALPLRSADPALSRIVRRRMDKMLKQVRRKDSIRAQVRRALLDNLTGGELTAASIARGLGLSDRTLHRRLRAENSSFADILDSTRGELAESLLPESGIGIGEIAFLLGFSEPSAFHRFFRRWTGRTPLAYRRAVG
jgi:AraC-like DNA-binding protein